MSEVPDETEETERHSTLPAINISVRGLEEEQGKSLAYCVGAYLGELGRHIDLERLDGVTIDTDYHQALRDLDRGYETSYQLSASSELVEGIAMAPSVIRDGVLKVHMILNAAYIEALPNPEDERYSHALHALAHESAHVEISMMTDKAFPNTLLRSTYEDVADAFEGKTESACWDEYAACRIAARFGRDPLDDYAESFILHLDETKKRADACIENYKTDESYDEDRLVTEVTGYYGNLIKVSAYLLGHMDGRDLSLDDVPSVRDALDSHWYAPYFHRLQAALRELWGNYGQWEHRSEFAPIGEIANDVLGEGGFFWRWNAGGVYGFRFA